MPSSRKAPSAPSRSELRYDEIMKIAILELIDDREVVALIAPLSPGVGASYN